MDDIINDEVLGSLKYNNGVWGRRLDTPVLNSDGNLIIVFQDDNKEGILDVQREAYKTYLQNEDKYKSSVIDLLLDYYKWINEYFMQSVSGIDETFHKDVVTEKQLFMATELWYLFICRDGSFGYAFGCCWDVDNGLAVLLSEDEPRVISRTQLENLHKLNDPTVGLLVHDGKKSWKGLEINSFFGKPENLEIELEGSVDEGITEAQQKAYSQYLEKKQNYFDEFTKILLGVYVGSDEAAEAMLKTGQKVLVKTVLPKTLFIDRNGNYGWICYTDWDDSYVGVLLSEDKPYLMREEDLREYSKKEKVKDDVLGLMFTSYVGFEKLIIVKLVDEFLTLPFSISIEDDRVLNDNMRNAYKTYLKMRPTFWNDIKKEFLKYYMRCYKEFNSYVDIPEELNKNNVNENSVMSWLTFTELYADYDGRIGWLCESPLNDESGYAFEFTDEKINLVFQDDLLI